jgi:hypothetical protein
MLKSQQSDFTLMRHSREIRLAEQGKEIFSANGFTGLEDFTTQMINLPAPRSLL